MSGTAKPDPAKGGIMKFRRSSTYAPRLSKESARRQGEITQLAFRLLGGRDGAMQFLNNAHAPLGGRPIDVAIASGEGFARVEHAIREIAEAP